MINFSRTAQSLVLTFTVSVLQGCATSPGTDSRPELILSAEKSLELGVRNYDENNFSKAEAHFVRALFLYRNIDSQLP